MELYDIPGFTGYKIDKNGNVYSVLKRGARDRKTEKYKSPEKLKPRPAKNGYLRVCMREDITGKRVDKFIHRLMAEIFLPNPRGLPWVNHIDTNRANNDLSNLEWCTPADNNNYTFETGHVKRNKNTGRYETGMV